MIKLLQINSVCGYGSTGRIVVELAEKVMKLGGECLVAYGQLSTTYPNSYKIGTKLENHLHNIFSRISGKQGYFTKRGTRKLIKRIEAFNPDIIHLANLHGNYLNFEILFKYLISVKKPVIWTLHDCWAYTGICTHYTEVGCYKWETECHHCPQVHRNSPSQSIVLDTSKKMFFEKKKWFTSIDNMTIIPVSKWLGNEVSRSFLSKYQIIPIYNWVNHNVFKPYDEDVKAKYGLPKEKFLVIGVSASWSNTEIRFQDFVALSKILPDDIQIVLVGKKRGKLNMPSEIIYIPYVHSPTELAKIYSNSDVYVHLSREDTFGKVIAEALSCGTPAIVYNATACPEIVGDGCGYVVDKGNIEKVKEKILQIRKEGKKMYSDACRNYVIKNFDMERNINSIIQLYLNKLNYDTPRKSDMKLR